MVEVMKNILLVSLCLFFAVGCQSYPKNATKVSNTQKVLVNRTVPSELTPYKLPTLVEYMPGTTDIPKTIIVDKVK